MQHQRPNYAHTQDTATAVATILEPAEPSTWPEYGYQLSVGSYGGLDDRYKRRKRKPPFGFQAPQAKPKAPRKRRTT